MYIYKRPNLIYIYIYIYIYIFTNLYIVFIYACLFTISWQFHCMLLSCFIL